MKNSFIKSKIRSTFWAPIIISLLGILIYCNTFNSSFHFDDIGDIVENPAIRDLSNIDAWWNYADSRPIAMFTFALNYYFHQYHVMGYHLVNSAIHIISALLVYWLIMLTLSTPTMRQQTISRHKMKIALCAGLLFVAHPLQTQAVTYIVQRMASMATMFYLLALTLYIKARLSPKKIRLKYALFSCAFISAVLGMLTKQITFTLPFAIVLYEYIFLKTEAWRLRLTDKRTIFSAAILLLLISIIPALLGFDFSLIFREIKPQQGHLYKITGADYLFTQFRVIVTYIRLLLFPVHQNVDYDYPIYHDFFNASVLSSFLLLLLIFISGIRLFKKYRLLAFGIFWFFLTLSVESSIIPIPNVIFEHRLYLPSIGFVIVLVGSLYYVLWRRNNYVAFGIMILIIGIFSILTFERNKVWKNDLLLWSDVVKKSPQNVRAWNNRGKQYLDKKEYALAVNDFKRALTINPYFYRALNNLGIVYLEQKDYQRAIHYFNQALAINPTADETLNNKGIIFLETQLNDSALYYFDKSLSFNPHFIKALNNRGVAYLSSRAYDSAIKDFSDVLIVDSYFLDAINNRGVAYRELGKYNRAIEDFNQAIIMEPGFEKAINNRGATYQMINNYDRALIDYNSVIRLNPEHLDARFNRGAIYREKKLYEKAIADFSKVIDLRPDSSAAYFNRAITYKEMGDYRSAVSDFSTMLTLDENNVEALTNRGISYLKMKDTDKAHADFDKALQLDPGNAKAFENRGNFYAHIGKLEHAVRDFTQAIALDSTYVEAYNNRGNTFAMLKQYDKAIYDYTTALSIDATYVNALYNRSICFYHQRNFKHAYDDVQQCQKLGSSVNEHYLHKLQTALKVRSY